LHHEYGHGISTRLAEEIIQVVCKKDQMGEGLIGLL
jgi:hypothetical protein